MMQPSRHVHVAATFVAMLFCVAATARADILHLTTGGTLEGRVVKTDTGYRIVTPTGSSTVPADLVTRWEKKKTPRESYAERVATVARDDVEGNFLLAVWCKRNGLDEKARTHFALVFQQDPDHEAARSAAGYVRHNGEWLTRDDYMRATGREKYDGRWMDAEEAETLRERDARAARQQAVYDAGWKRMRAVARAARTGEDVDVQAEAVRFFRVGPDSLPLLDRLSRDSSETVREIAVVAASLFDEIDAADILFDRALRESDERILRRVRLCLADHPARKHVLERSVRYLLQCGRDDRRRIAETLEVIADARVVDMLIPHAAFDAANAGLIRNLTPEKAENLTDAPEDADVRTNVESEDDSRAWYPAAETLADLTGRDLGPDVDAWRTWWDEHEATFRFPSRPVPIP